MLATARNLLVSALLATGLPGAATAAMPEGTLVFEFSGDDRIYDFGSMSECDTYFEPGVSIDLCVDLTMIPDGKGGYDGTIEMDFDAEAFGIGISGSLSGPATGKLSGKDGGALDKASFKVKLSGSLFVEGYGSVFTQIPFGCKGLVDDLGFLFTFCKGKVKLSGLGSAPVEGYFESTVEGGTWSVTVQVDGIDEKSFGGTAADTLGFGYEVKGKYSDSKGESKIQLKGLKDTPSKGAKIQLKGVTSAGPGDASGEAKYKVQGYKGSAEVATD